jgi:hypothetical protein
MSSDELSQKALHESLKIFPLRNLIIKSDRFSDLLSAALQKFHPNLCCNFVAVTTGLKWSSLHHISLLVSALKTVSQSRKRLSDKIRRQ